MATEVTKGFKGSRMQKTPGNWQATEVYTVTGAASKSAAIDAVVAAYPTHPDNSAMRINPPVADNIGLNIWRVTAQYTFNGTLGVTNPLEEPTRFRADIERITVPIDTDIDGNPLVNSAGDPYEGVTEDRTFLVLYMERNIPSFSVSQGLAFTNKVNTDSLSIAGVGGYDPGQALCRIYRPVSEWKFGDDYVRVQAIIAFADSQNPWDTHLKDQGRNGWRAVTAGPATRGKIVHGDGGDPGLDVALDGTGKPLLTDYGYKILEDATSLTVTDAIATPDTPAGLTVDDTRSTATSKILEWKTKFGANFADLPF